MYMKKSFPKATESITCDRQFRWLSSVTGDPEILSNLNQKMAWFYGQVEGRSLYQEMLNEQEESLPSEESVRYLMPKYVSGLKPQSILEIGCGNGRLYRQLRSYEYTGQYTGLDVADYLIQENTQRHPEATWRQGMVYQLPFPDASFDVCFSLYVLEHLVYPESGLSELLRVLKPNGRLVLVFPDFVESGRLASQKLGLSPIGAASEKLRKGKIIDALVSLYDSRIRLQTALKQAKERFGAFPVNTQPICLSFPELMAPDIDAVYIASKVEVQNWAQEKGHTVEFPCGTEGEFAEQAFLVIIKN
jgi:ubiquinone/menaquinone biosynthesis C-methylase UbiE